MGTSLSESTWWFGYFGFVDGWVWSYVSACLNTCKDKRRRPEPTGSPLRGRTFAVLSYTFLADIASGHSSEALVLKDRDTQSHDDNFATR